MGSILFSNDRQWQGGPEIVLEGREKYLKTEDPKHSQGGPEIVPEDKQKYPKTKVPKRSQGGPEIVLEDREKYPKTEVRKPSKGGFEMYQRTKVPQHSKGLCIVQSILQAVVIAATAVALYVLVTSKQEAVIMGLVFEAKYSYSPAFKFLAGADAVVCGFSALSLIISCVAGSHSKSCSHFVLFLHDLVMTMLMISAFSAAIREGAIAKYGAEHMGWTALCNRVPEFCNRVTISAGLSAFSCVAYFLLTIMSARRLMFSSSN
ncbi:CASP-like protein 1F1 [Punica granatum]|uniref:CASP-like protein n=2 Tax=Punica granatum TaxID=22663 RepID=A0A218WCW4_PUNGR|nr:CASP-like protein 1F1 [Punica granatum]OWM70717.1 hypothetical protein CDL15_Pgr014390 [Punica granatum]PKI32862.1 hypothetical protein CRG98_046747 [Punica granatum]